MTSLKTNEKGAAFVTALLVLMLASGLMAGMYAALMANTRTHATDRDQSVAYAAAHAGLEKLTANLGALFAVNFAPTAAQIAVVDSTPPTIPGFTYATPGGGAGTGYDITFTPIPNGQPNAGDPQALPNVDITTGPFEGLKGLITPYVLTVTARSTTGNSEVRLRRELQTVAVPVFQFGIFGENALGFHAGPNFDFGGRVHTNESLFLAAGDGSTLTFRDKITAVTQVVRNTLSNGVSIALTNHEGNVSVPTTIGTPGAYRNLLASESSGLIFNPLTGPCIALATIDSNCWTGWKNRSEVTYRTNIRTAATGARTLNLPLTTMGAEPIDLIRRPALDELVTDPVYGQRYYAQASLRILLSDRATDITDLPGVTADPPLQLDGPGPTGYAVGAERPPIALSPGNEPLRAGTSESATRVSAFNGGPLPAATDLTIQNWNGAAWVNGIPPWLRPTILAGAGSTCTAVSGTQLSNCGVHPAYANGTAVTFTFTLPDGTIGTWVTTVAGNPAANSATINIANSVVNRFAATRVFFAGQDKVGCTGWNNANNRLTGCTSNANPDVDVNDPIYVGATTQRNTPLLNGFIKIEKQGPVGVWTDVTLEILNLGFAAPNQVGDPCPDPTPRAVIRLMRLRDNTYTNDLCSDDAADAPFSYHTNALWSPTDFWPNMLFDPREGHTRLQPTDNTQVMHMGGLFGYVAFDANNFRRWVNGDFGGTGAQTLDNNGYIIYFSDRRGDHNENDPTTPDVETGEYGHEDSINHAAQVWAQTDALEQGEDFNGNGTLETYGETPHNLAVPATAVPDLGFDLTQRPWSSVGLNYTGRGQLARPVLFRRSLKIINGGINGGVNSLPAAGINIVAENPIYIQGNFNATSASVTAEPNVPAAVIGDAITLLSDAFRDSITFQFPQTQDNRNATTTGYRFAMVTGKSIPFRKPVGWGVNELGSDGGVHNFMRMIEDWGGQNLRYRGSMVSLFYSRQAVGIYRADANTYGAPTRGYNFDTDFLSPPLLPPGTPMFRDINTLKFRQILRPNQ
jgi:hypothetical protein